MNKSDIGLNAGKIWRLLSNYAKWDYGTLKRKSGLKDKELGAAKSSSRYADIIALADSSLIHILEDAEKLRSKNNLLLNSCRLSLQHLNKVQLLANIDEEVRQLTTITTVSYCRTPMPCFINW